MVKLGSILLSLLLVVVVVVAAAQGNETVVRVKVGAVLDIGTQGATVGKIGLSCIKMSLSEFYITHPHYKTRIQLIVTDSKRDLVTAATHAQDLIEEEQVKAIMGPVTTMEAIYIISLGYKFKVPIVTFSATSPSLSSLHSPYFFQIAQDDSSQVNAIVDLVQAFNWKQVVPIYVHNTYGEGLIPCLTNSLQQAYVRIPYLSAIPLSATDDAVGEELYKLKTMQTRVFVVHMTPTLGSRLFEIAKRNGMMEEGYVWIVTNGMANFFDDLELSAMQGVIGVRPYVRRTKELDEFRVRWRREFVRENPTLVDADLNVFGVWAYDAATALAMAVENAFADAGSRSGEKLREGLSNSRFAGMSGEFNVVGGRLQGSALEIVNVIGNGVKRAGFWTKEKGLIRNRNILDSKIATVHSAPSKNNLGTIIWPGDTNSAPKGWEIPTSGKRLKVGVPVKDGGGYTEFVTIKRNPPEVTGYCIDVFQAVLQVLPYALACDFIPFEKNGEMAGTYDDLVNQVYNGTFDAVVGDVTIIANRSLYVDFTLPYTESGVTMVVAVRDNRKKNAWAFLKPLTWDLWVTTACYFVFVGFVVWALEHRVNSDFRGPPSYQVATSLWFSFSTLVFAHREKVVSNLGRFVVIVWVFVVQILVQSYTASLTSLLTVEQLRPTITDVHQLLKNGMNVGYLEGSFVSGILKGLGFQDKQLKSYRSPEECNDLFNKGSANGGIDAAFDEVPYVKHLLGTYCSKYAMMEPRFKTGGFGFVFPKGSPLVADISRAILNVTQGDKMRTIENAWFNGSTCADSNAQFSSNSLGLESFWGLFLVVGVSSLLALTIFSLTFLYQHRHVWSSYNNPGTSLWTRIETLLGIFNSKDVNSHTFKKSGEQDSSETSSPAHHHHHGHGIGAEETSLSTHFPQSPSSHAESNLSFHGDQGMFSPDPRGYATQDQDIRDSEMMVVQNITPEAVVTNNTNTNSQAK